MKLTYIALTAFALGLASLSASADDVDQRLQNQQNRINQGVQNGSLTAKEQQNVQARDVRIQASEAKDKAANGGKLTSSEEKNLNRRLNRNSRKIYRKKHNATNQ